MASSKASLIFDHSPFQNEDDLCKKSFLGGMPELPKGIDWPRNSNNEPLHFLAQVDFEDVNASCKMGVINFNINVPKTGRILFFADTTGDSLWNDDGKAVKVIFIKNGILSGPIQASPVDLKSPLLGDCTNYSLERSVYRPVDIPGRMPRHFPKVNISMRAVNSYPVDYNSSNIYLSEYFEIPKSIESEFSYERNRHLPNLWWPWLIEKSYEDLRRPPTVDIPESYPWNWYIIERSCQEIHSEVQRISVSFNNPNSSDKLPSLCRKIFDSTIIDVEQWIEKAALHNEYEEVSTDTSVQFNTWLKSMPKKIGKPIPKRKIKGDWALINWISPDRKYISDYTWWDNLVVGMRKLLGIEKKIKEKLLTKLKLNSMLKSALPNGIRSSWPYIRAQDVSKSIPKDIVDRLNIDCMPLNYGDGQLHFMFGNPVEVQDLGDIPDKNVLLLQIASDKALHLMWGDVGILQVWIKESDLAIGNFENITFTADCH